MKNNLTLIFLLLILLFVGTWRISASPATWFDEGINLGIAKSLVQNGVYSLKTGPGEFVENRQFLITSNYPVIAPAALSIKLFGFNLAAARAPMVLFLLAFAIAAYFLARKMYSKKAALFSLALIISFAPFYGNGKAVLGEIPGLFYFLCALILLARSNLFFAGFFIGLSAASKPFFLIVPAAVLAVEAACRKNNFKVLLKRLLLLASGAVLPITLWLYTILPKWSLSGLLSALGYYSNSYASGNFTRLIFENFLRFFTEATPIHFAVLFLASAVFIISKKRKGGNASETEIILAAFALLTLAFYLKTPGWYRYFFPAHMILFLVFPAALLYLLRRRAAEAILILLILFQFGYLINQRNSPLYNSDEADIFSKYVLKNVPENYEIFVVNAPSVAFLLDGRQIYQFLQINPVLFFGKNALERDGAFYPYVITQGDITGLDFPNLEKNLSEKYMFEKEVGHYVLYKLAGQ